MYNISQWDLGRGDAEVPTCGGSYGTKTLWRPVTGSSTY